MTTPAKGSKDQGVPSGQDNPLQGSSAGTEGAIIGAPAVPAQVLAVVSEENLPAWFKPFWEHLCALRDNQAKDLADVRRDVDNVRRVLDRLDEHSKRVQGVEVGLGEAESKLDELKDEGQKPIIQIQALEKRIEEIEQENTKLKIGLERAQEARSPADEAGALMRARGDGAKNAETKEGVTAAHNQSVSFWPGSKPPPTTLPPMGADFGGAQVHGEHSAPIQDTKPDVGSPWSSSPSSRQPVLGPLVPHLEPLRTILQPFETVMDYRHYRLRDMTDVPTETDLKHLYKLKDKAQSYHRSLAVFDGTDPLKLFEFLSVFKRAMNDLGKSEAVAVRGLSYFLDGDAMDTYNVQMTSDLAYVDGQETATWPHVVNSLLSTFITDDLLQTAYDEVVQARQKPKEPVANFILRLQDLAKQCHGVFPQAEMANMVLRGMKPAIRQRIQHTVDNLAHHEKISLPKIRQLAVQEDNAQREQAQEFSQSSATGPKAGRKAGDKAGKTMHIGGLSDAGMPSPPTTPSASHASVPIETLPANRAHDPVQMVDSAAGMSFLFAITEQPLQKAIERNRLDPTSIMQAMNALPGLSDEQLDQAMSVIPSDYWRLSCWTCREQGHVTYVCPYLEPKQRVFFAYCYYMHQVQSNPELKAWYKKRLDFFRGQGPSPGPRPGSEFTYGGGRGRGGGGFGKGGAQRTRLQARPPPALPPLAAAAGALPAPAEKPAAAEPAAPVAVVQENSTDNSDSSENE